MLTLDKVPLIEAIPDLNRWYNADIRLGDPALAGRKIIGGFKLGSLTDLAAILELTFDVRVVRDANTLTLYSK
jgi:ferric-dicitrate binding protein FerR (iron transport regulator)